MYGRGRILNQAAVCLQSQCTYPAHSSVAPVYFWKAKAGRPFQERAKRGLAEASGGRILQPKPWYPGVQVGAVLEDCQGGSGIHLGPGSCWVLCATTYPTLFWAPCRSLSRLFQEANFLPAFKSFPGVSWLSKKESLRGMEGGEIE